MTILRQANHGDAFAALQAPFARGERMVTLHGSTGVGKTHLARRFTQGPRAPAASVLGEGTPVVWCSCTSSRDRDDLLRVIARALATPIVRDDALAHLCEALALRGGVLLVLDEVDAALDAAREMLPSLVSSCSELRVLATAQSPLEVEGEACVELSPLDENESAALWEEFGGGALDDADDRAALAALGGNALAIEITAQGDSASLRLLRDSGGADPVGSALVAAGNSLDDALRVNLAEASVFEDGFTLEAAEAVLSAGPLVAGLLSDLVARRLVRAQEELPARRVRFSLSEPVRAFAARELERSGRSPDVVDRHAKHFLARARAWLSEYAWRGIYAGIVSLDREQANLAAVATRVDEARAAPAERSLRRALARLYQTPSVLRTAGLSAHLDAVDRELDDALAAGASEASLLPLWAARAWRAERQGRYEDAAKTFEHALARAPEVDRRDLEGHLLRGLALARMHQGRIDDALAAAERARFALERGERVGESAWALLLTGQILYERGAFDDATGTLARTLLRAREHGNELVEARSLLTLGEAELALGRHDGARLHLREALVAFLQIGEPAGVATTHEVLARLLHDQGRTDASLAEFQAAVDQAALLGEVTLCARAEVSLAALLHEFGHLHEARALLDRSLSHLAVMAPRVAAFGRAHLASVFASLGEHESAEREIDAAREVVISPGDRFTPVIRALRVFVILCKAREFPPEEARRVAREARHELAAIKSLPPEECGVELRIAMRLLSGFDGDALLRPSAELVRPQNLVAQRMGLWFIPPGAAEVSLRTRTTLAILLRRLGEQRCEAPGRSLSPESLIADMWPGEKIIPKAARNRLHVAVRTLRTMGLGTILRSDQAGYHLDPTVPFRFMVDETN